MCLKQNEGALTLKRCQTVLILSTLIAIICGIWLIRDTSLSMKALHETASSLLGSEASVSDVYVMAVKDSYKYALTVSTSFLIMITMVLANLIFIFGRRDIQSSDEN